MDLMNKHDWFISPIVQLELQYLHEIGRIEPDADSVVAEMSKKVGLQVCPKPFQRVIVQAMHLTWTRDPFDRILVAHAAIDKDILVSSDANIGANYAYTKWDEKPNAIGE